MKGSNRTIMLLVTVLTALALSAMWTVPVLADDILPPPPDAPLESAPAEEAPPPETTLDAPPVEGAPAASEAAPPIEEPARVEETVSERPAEAPTETPPIIDEAARGSETVAELLEQMPDGTELVVLDENGEALPFAAEETSEIIAGGDPIWCPVGVTPQDGLGGCSPSAGTLNDLLYTYVFTATGPGVIWMEGTNFGGLDAGNLVIDGSLPKWLGAAGYALTIQGGWQGLGTTIVDPNDPTTISKPLSIIGWTGAVTISDLIINNVTGADALYIDTAGPVKLTRVQVKNNTAAGAEIHSDGAVTVTNGTFSGNTAGLGLEIISLGAVTLSNIDAIGNTFGGGVAVNNSAGTGNVTLLGVNVFSENAGTGLYVSSRGAINLSNIAANYNASAGAAIFNSTGSTQPVTLTGASEFKYNGQEGLFITSAGAITLNKITATNNSTTGVYLSNTASLPAAPKNVTLLGYGVFRDNDSEGLYVQTYGAITLSNVTAEDNWKGAYLNNYGNMPFWGSASTAKPVTLSGINNFNLNGAGGGLWIIASGAVTLSKVSANDNMAGGILVKNNNLGSTKPQNVTFTSFANAYSNGGPGIEVNSYGTILGANITASYNTSWGAQFDNHLDGAGVPKAVTLTGNNTFEGNTGGIGLSIHSLGAITVNNVIASGNSSAGALLWNDYANAVGGVSVLNTPTYWPEFSENGGAGLLVFSRGTITVKDLDAINNDDYGVCLTNSNSTTGTANVFFGTSRAGWWNGLYNNLYSGLEISSTGAVTLSNIYAEYNGENDGFGGFYGYGVFIDNRSALVAAPKPVTLLGSVENGFEGNHTGGLLILSDGAITLNKVTAFGTADGPGVELNNLSATSLVPQNVTINGYGEFWSNAGPGLNILTYGAVTLNKLYAEDNIGDGIHIDNGSGSLARGVTINGYVDTSLNTGGGLWVSSLGAIKIADLSTEDNAFGALLDNSAGAPGVGVSLTVGVSVHGNTTYGLEVLSRGPIGVTVADTWTTWNGTYGWHLKNSFPGSVGGITLKVAAGESMDFSDNGGYGILAESFGNISAINLDAYSSGEYGAWLNNAFPGATGTVTITTPVGNNSFGGNDLYGLRVDSNGAITITNLSAWSNDQYGVKLDNSGSGTVSPKNVTINGAGYFYENGLSGLQVLTYGAVTLNNIYASDNGWHDAYPDAYGAYIDNCNAAVDDICAAAAPKGVTLNGTNTFNGNHYIGLSVISLGAIKVNNLTAAENNGVGASLDNAWRYTVGITQVEALGQGITITGVSYLEANMGHGLVAYSHGAVTLSNLTASWNADDGVHIENRVDGSFVNVSLLGTNSFLGNGDDGTGNGLYIKTDGNVTINNLTASWNPDSGAYINNYNWGDPLLPPFVKLTGINTFLGNGGSGNEAGLSIESKGNVDLARVTADDNYFGVLINTDGNITLTCASINSNTTTGLYISADSGAVVTLIHVIAYGNAAPVPFSNITVLGAPTTNIIRTCPLP